MVRSITGFLVDVGGGILRRKLRKEPLPQEIAPLGLTAPPQGLNLVKIYYDEKDFLDKLKTMG